MSGALAGAVETYPLTEAQAGIWTGQRLDPGNPTYTAAEYVLLRGQLDTSAFETALRRTLAEAPALHARFPDHETQLIAPSDGWRLARPWLTDLAAARTWMRADLSTPVDPATGPLFGHALIELGDGTHLWYQRIHHIAADGYAFALLARRVAEHYTAEVTGGDPARGRFAPLRPVIDEDLAYRAGPRYAADRRFWREQLAGAPPAVTLAPPRPLGHEVLRHRVRLPDALAETGPAWGYLVMAAVAALLHRRTGADDVVLGLPVAGRLGSAALRVPCMAMNIVPLRVGVPPSATLRRLSGAIAEQVRATRRHHRYRYEQLRRDLGMVGGERRLFGPVVNVMPFDFRLPMHGLTAGSHNVAAGPVDDLSVAVADRGEGRYLDLDANPACYRPDDLAGYAAELVDLLGGDPDAAVARRPPVAVAPTVADASSPATPVTVIDGGSPATPVTVVDGGPLPAPVTPVTDLVARIVDGHPGRVAVVEPGVREVTYGELAEAADRVARRLCELGVEPGSIVAVSLPRGADAIAAILGVLRHGGAYLPLDPDGPRERRDGVLDDLRPAALITVGGIAALPDAAAPGGDLAYVIHTSGSTGTPNGVAVGRLALARFVAAATARYAITEADRVLQFAPLHFDASVEEIFLTLAAGATLVVRAERMLDSMPAFVAGCAEHAVTVLDLPTAFWHELAYAELPMPPTVRTVVIGGEAALAERVARWRRTVGPGVRLINTYGPTEATVVATAADLSGAGDDRPRSEGDLPGSEGDVPIGRPLPGVRCAIVGGELYLLGGCLAEGYRNRPELTAQRYVEITGERAYRTGDLVRLGADGQLHYLGRSDEQLKISGHRIDPAEVESVLLRHPGVVEVAVVGHDSPSGGKRLVAHVVGDVADGELRRHAATALPAAAVPTAFARAARLPRTDTGKIDRSALRRHAVGAANADGDLTPAQRTVVAAWREVLGAAEIRPDDDFFALGGQSLQTIQLANRLAVPVTTVFANPTVTALARAIDPPGGDAPPPRTPAEHVVDEAPATRAPAAHVVDAVLAADVMPRPRRPVGRILLTGATGFVGPHLLVALLRQTRDRVACLVRADAPAPALDRLRAALDRQGLRPPLDRVDVVPGSLDHPYRGPDVDAIVHCAASVSVVRDYPSLRAANVSATARLLSLGVPTHHVSTLAVATAPGFVAAHPGLRDGYQRSKWAAEELVRQAGERGIPVAVYRLGRVVGAADTGYVNRTDLVWRILLAGVPRGVLPDLDIADPWTPADWVATTIAAGVSAGATGVHNLVPRHRVHFGQIVEWIREYGFAVRTLALAGWRERVGADATDDELATLAFFDRAPGFGEVLTDASRGGAPVAPAPPAQTPAPPAQTPAPPAQTPAPPRTAPPQTAPPQTAPPRTAPPWTVRPGPAVDRALMFRYLDRAVADGLLPGPWSSPARRSRPSRVASHRQESVTPTGGGQRRDAGF